MEGTFVVDEVSAIIKEAMETIIGGNVYQHSKVPQWTNTTVEHILGQLTKMNKPFKYIVTCVIMEKNGAGLHTATSCYWDNTTDGSCTCDGLDSKYLGVDKLLVKCEILKARTWCSSAAQQHTVTMRTRWNKLPH